MMEFSTLDLPVPVMEGIRDAGFVTATPIQEGAAAGPARQGRRGTVADGHRQDGRLSHLGLHADDPRG